MLGKFFRTVFSTPLVRAMCMFPVAYTRTLLDILVAFEVRLFELLHLIPRQFRR